MKARSWAGGERRGGKRIERKVAGIAWPRRPQLGRGTCVAPAELRGPALRLCTLPNPGTAVRGGEGGTLLQIQPQTLKLGTNVLLRLSEKAK